MKKFLYIILIGLFSSCDSLLDVEPETMVSFDNFYKTEQDLEVTLYQLQDFVHGRLFDAQVQESAGMLDDYTNNFSAAWKWTPTTIIGTPGTNWGMPYWVVYMANVLLENMGSAAGEVSPERLRYYEAQACFAKGLAYFIIGQRWGAVPITRNSTSAEAYGNKPILEVLDTAIANATKAFNYLPKQSELQDRLGTAITSRQFGSKGSAAALLAHAYAWKGSLIDLLELEGNSKDCYDKSIEYATCIIDGDVGHYRFAGSPEALCLSFSNIEKENPETIFELTMDMQSEYVISPYVLGGSYIGYPYNPDITASGHRWSGKSLISKETIDDLYEDQDLRPAAYFYRYSYFTSMDTIELMFTEDKYTEEQRQYKRDSVREENIEKTGGYAYPNKWRSFVFTTSPNSSSKLVLSAVKTNYAYWRLSDIYLLRAECYVKTGQDGLAQSDLNRVRSNANAVAYPGGRDDGRGLQYAIFHEREREFLMEGHRFFDVVRNGMEYINKELRGSFTTMTQSEVKDGAIFLPIFDDAFKLNSLLRQNLYWSQFIN